MPANNVIIRGATEDDLPGILALYAQPELDDGDILPLDAAKALYQRFSAYPSYTLYAVEADGTIVGTFALLIMDNLGHLGAPSAIVEDVAVSPACQSQGIGAQMMTFAVARAQDAGCYKLTLSSNAKRERAHAFYESLGFARHGYSFRMDLQQQGAAA